jgi:hypothetical protein
MVDIEQSLASACLTVPGVVTGALVAVPEGVLIGGVGASSAFDHEPLVRGAARVTTERCVLPKGHGSSKFVEYAIVSDDQLVVILRGHRCPWVVLALACTREANLALVLGSARVALRNLESTVDLTPWEQ